MKLTSIAGAGLSLAAFAAAATAPAALHALATNTTAATTHINTLCGCGFRTTLQALQQRAPVVDGTACAAADKDIADTLGTLDGQMQSALAQVEADHSTDATTLAAAFNDFATSFYALWNALDLAECTYVLTPSSRTHAAAFGTGVNSVEGAFDALVGAVNATAQPGIAAANFKQQTHFAGTGTLAVGVTERATGLLGCEAITTVVQSEGGGTSCPS